MSFSIPARGIPADYTSLQGSVHIAEKKTGLFGFGKMKITYHPSQEGSAAHGKLFITHQTAMQRFFAGTLMESLFGDRETKELGHFKGAWIHENAKELKSVLEQANLLVKGHETSATKMKQSLFQHVSGELSTHVQNLNIKGAAKDFIERGSQPFTTDLSEDLKVPLQNLKIKDAAKDFIERGSQSFMLDLSEDLKVPLIKFLVDEKTQVHSELSRRLPAASYKHSSFLSAAKAFFKEELDNFKQSPPTKTHEQVDVQAYTLLSEKMGLDMKAEELADVDKEAEKKFKLQ